jgi:hypothetical protein
LDQFSIKAFLAWLAVLGVVLQYAFQYLRWPEQQARISVLQE